MNSQGNDMTQREFENLLQSLISHFYSKSLHIIVGSRVPSLHSHHSDCWSTVTTRASDQWFHLLLGNPPTALENLNYLPYHPMIIDIVLLLKGTNNSSSNKTVLERWIVHYEHSLSPALAPQYQKAYQKAYHKSTILLRSLYSQMRLLPVHSIFRRLSTSFNTFNFDIDYQISWFTDPFSRDVEKMMEQYNFKAIEAFLGRLSISVTYRTTLVDLKLDEFPTHWTLPKFMKDYVGCPNIIPVMRGLRPMPCVTVKHHSCPCCKISDFPTHRGFGNMIPSYSMQNQLPLAADPKATIYPLGMGKGFGNFSHSSLDFSGNLSPRSTKDGNSLRKSSSDNKSTKKMEVHRAGGVKYSRTINYGDQKIGKGNKDDSLSSYPFSVKDVDMLGVEPSQNANDMDRKSQNVALGVLAHKLRVPPPLHQNHFLHRKMDDSLEELRNYKIMGDRLSKYEV
ncbi:hypothetical protein K1719_018133 [Acacia pycnantha]|nr:hypothetical protein K1719_018133 [Acacia pycnantha]